MKLYHEVFQPTHLLRFGNSKYNSILYLYEAHWEKSCRSF